MSACPLCGHGHAQSIFQGTDRLFGTTDRQFQVVECTQCRFLRLYPKPADHELGQFYPPDYYFSPSPGGVSQLSEIYRRLVLSDHVRFVERATKKRKGLLLDVGCSGGLVARLLRDRGVKALGFDNSLSAARAAWQSNGVPVICGDFLKAPLQTESCSVLTMFHVLEHVPDPQAYLKKAFELLAKDGRLVVQVPNAASWQFLMFGEHWNGVDIPRHLWNFRISDLERVLDQCGFEIVRRKYFSLRDNPAGMATSFAPSLDPMARRVRGVKESEPVALLRNLLYLGLTLACLPFTVLEAVCRAGSTVMVEARPRK